MRCEYFEGHVDVSSLLYLLHVSVFVVVVVVLVFGAGMGAGTRCDRVV